ncbi:MAG: hypothetical protein AB8H79_11355 [Myxococcota bacterium]
MRWPIAIAVLMGVMPALAKSPPELAWRHEGAVWRSPTVFERNAVRQAARALAEDKGRCSDSVIEVERERLAGVGLRLDVFTSDGVTLVLLREGAEFFGAGILAYRCGPARPLVWQAPHPFFDLKTGNITLRLFEESGARAGMWSTYHRFRAEDEEVRQDSVHPADVSAEPGSLFQAMTVGLASGDRELRFVQVHGFARVTAKKWDAIVSSGDSRRPPLAVGGRLESVLGVVGVYGADDLPLGATLNAQGRILPSGRFLHLELNPTVRAKLRNVRKYRKALSDAIMAGPW